MKKNNICVTAVIVLLNEKILSWKAVLGKIDFAVCGLSEKYFFGQDKSKIKIEQKTFYHATNDEKLWKKAELWRKKWKIHPVAQKAIEEGMMFSPY
jgi:hypothetical protein